MTEDNKMATNEMDVKFLKHLTSLPVVDNTWAQLSAYYNMAKDYNVVLRFALTTAESGAMKMLNTAQPVLNKYQPQITKVDNFACDQLTKIEEKYPVIKKTPKEIVIEGKEMCSNLVQPAVDKVNSVKEFSSSTLNSVKQLASLESSKAFSKKQIQKATEFTQSQLTWLLQTDYGQQLLHQVENYLSMSEETLDKYLPPVQDEETEESLQGESMAQVGNLSKKIAKRVYAKAIKDLRALHTNTKEAVEKLFASVNLIEIMQNNYESSKQTIQNLHEKLLSTWSDSIPEEDLACKPEEKTDNDLAISMVQKLTHQVKDTINKIYKKMPETPAVVKQLAEESYNYTESLYNSVKQAESFQEVSALLCSKSAESVLGLQQVLQTLIETPFSYVQELPVTEEIEMESMTLKKSEERLPEDAMEEKGAKEENGRKEESSPSIMNEKESVQATSK